MTIKDLTPGQSAIISAVGGEGALRQHFLDMGVIPGAEIKVVKYAPMGDPVELLIHGYKLTLRLSDAEKIEVETTEEKSAEEAKKQKRVKKGGVRGGGGSTKPSRLRVGGKEHLRERGLEPRAAGPTGRSRSTLPRRCR